MMREDGDDSDLAVNSGMAKSFIGKIAFSAE